MRPLKSRWNHRLQLESLEDRRLLTASGLEQEAVYLINRARHDPAAYQSRQNLSVNISSLQSRPPLAVSPELFNSTQTKSNDMVANNYFAHASPSGVQANALARQAGFPLPDAFVDGANNIESLAAGTSYDNAAEAINALIVDAGVPGALHRQHLLATTDFWALSRQIGVGFASSTNASFDNYWSIHTGPRNVASQFLTGVVFDDANGDGHYNAGEGLANVIITIDGSQTLRTNAAGGWSALVQPGDHHVQASGGQFAGISTASTTVAGDTNVEVDFISGQHRGYVSFAPKLSRNTVTPQDVNAENGVTPLDALLILNYLSRGSDAATQTYTTALYMDVSDNGEISPLDALLVINELSDRASAEQASGEMVDTTTIEARDFLFANGFNDVDDEDVYDPELSVT